MKSKFLKGKLTKLSAAFLVLFQTPNLLSQISQTAEAFADAAGQPLTWFSAISAAGVIWGGIRRACGYFESMPRLVIETKK